MIYFGRLSRNAQSCHSDHGTVIMSSSSTGLSTTGSDVALVDEEDDTSSGIG